MSFCRCPDCNRLYNYLFTGSCVICCNPDGDRCVYCGGEGTTRDHIIPKSLGGKETVPACYRCNQAKGNLFLACFLRIFTVRDIKYRKRLLLFSEKEREMMILNINKLIDKQISTDGEK